MRSATEDLTTTHSSTKTFFMALWGYQGAHRSHKLEEADPLPTAAALHWHTFLPAPSCRVTLLVPPTRERPLAAKRVVGG
jgi:hypothetical protein